MMPSMTVIHNKSLADRSKEPDGVYVVLFDACEDVHGCACLCDEISPVIIDLGASNAKNLSVLKEVEKNDF